MHINICRLPLQYLLKSIQPRRVHMNLTPINYTPKEWHLKWDLDYHLSIRCKFLKITAFHPILPPFAYNVTQYPIQPDDPSFTPVIYQRLPKVIILQIWLHFPGFQKKKDGTKMNFQKDNPGEYNPACIKRKKYLSTTPIVYRYFSRHQIPNIIDVVYT